MQRSRGRGGCPVQEVAPRHSVKWGREACSSQGPQPLLVWPLAPEMLDCPGTCHLPDQSHYCGMCCPTHGCELCCPQPSHHITVVCCGPPNTTSCGTCCPYLPPFAPLWIKNSLYSPLPSVLVHPNYDSPPLTCPPTMASGNPPDHAVMACSVPFTPCMPMPWSALFSCATLCSCYVFCTHRTGAQTVQKPKPAVIQLGKGHVSA